MKPPPKQRPVVMCASNRWKHGQSREESFLIDESFLEGGAFGGFHGYHPSIPDTWGDHGASEVWGRPYAMANVKGLDPGTPERLSAFAETVPPNTIIILNHEPSNPDKNIDSQQFRNVFNQSYEQFSRDREYGRFDSSIELWSNFMSYLFRTPDRDPIDWIPMQPDGSLSGDGILLNGYHGETTPSYESIFTTALMWLDATFGDTYRWGIGEISCHTQSHVGDVNGDDVPYDGPFLLDFEARLWVQNTFDAAERDGAEVIAWFSSPVGPRGPWYLDAATGAGIATWQATS